MSARVPPVSPLKGIFQFAYVTRDFDHALDVFSEAYGMTEFGRMSNVELSVPSGGTIKIEVGLAWIDDVQIEIIEPRGGVDNIYREVLDGRDSDVVLHHLGMLLESRQALEEPRQRSLAAGRDVVLCGEIESVSAFMYTDARATLGLYLEYLYFSPERLAYHRAMPRF